MQVILLHALSLRRSMEVHKRSTLIGNKFKAPADMHICRYADMQICRYADMQIWHKLADMAQIGRYGTNHSWILSRQLQPRSYSLSLQLQTVNSPLFL